MDIRAFRLIIDKDAEVPYQLKAEVFERDFGWYWRDWGGFSECDLCYKFAQDTAIYYADTFGADLLEERYANDDSRDWFIDRRYIQFGRKYPYRLKK